MEINIDTEIIQGAKKLGINLSTDKVNLLVKLVRLLNKWNKIHNLTAIKGERQIVNKHILDSLSIVPYLTGNTILDVGSGAGFPGVVIAILFPEKQITTIDSNNKKTTFMLQVKIELGLVNLNVEHSRVENYHPNTKFDIITSRAFASISRMLKLTNHLLSDSGSYLMMKGVFPTDELEEVKKCANFTAIKCKKLQVPNVNEDRHLVVLSHQN